ncbi:MAG: tetratricopeptide repeat protein [Anaerolineae bacterium]|nr:tetratricopeptide repeat protein [Anaerolineae bacterium]
MQCPSCGTINPAQARFCMSCGLKLTQAQVCRSCHSLLPAQARYCFYCGAFLGEAAATGVSIPIEMGIPIREEAPPASIQTNAHSPRVVLGQLPTPRPLEEILPMLHYYLPNEMVAPLERRPQERHFVAARDHLTHLLRAVKTYLPWPVITEPQPPGEPRGEMRKGVFLFGDVSGFTALSESLKHLEDGAERVAEIINTMFAELVRELFDHGGTLLKFGGDSLLGLFSGETVAELRESALRATQAGMAMLEVMQQDKYAAIEVAGKMRALKIKCGISAGPYFAAHIGTPPTPTNYNGMMAYITTGHTVNQAEEAESHANPGEAVMTEAAYALIGDEIQVGEVTREPDDGFVQVLTVPQADKSAITRPHIGEPPTGELPAQITYLVSRLNMLTPYLSDELIQRIKDNPVATKIVPEYRPVTIMFVNYKGISDLITKTGEVNPDLVTQQLNEYFGHMARIVEKYEGTLARIDQYALGDRLVVFFGAPNAHEDDPIRAVYTAMEMQAAVHENFGALRTASGIFRFEQRIGINTGYLFAGNAGAPDLRQEYTLMGDDINMAARLMAHAPWGAIYIGSKTAEQTRSAFKLGERFDLKVKGKDLLIPTYEVLGNAEVVEPTCEMDQESPFVGRQEEMDVLQERGRSLLNKRGQIVALIGNSGLGKSRIKREFRTWLQAQTGENEDEEVLWLEGRALAFSEQTSYWLIAQVLRSALELPENAGENDVLYALWKKGEKLLGDEAMEVIPFLANLMNLELGKEWAWVKNLAPTARQKQTFWAAGEFFTCLARQRPVVLTLNDLHWADEASLALIESLLDITDRAPVMFFLIFRARRDKGCWRLRNAASSTFPHRYVEINLKALSREAGEALLNALLGGAIFEAAIQKNILDKAAGNPFYLEEVVRTMRESGAVIPDPAREGRWIAVPEKAAQIEVPNTLHAAIVTRIDRLTEDSRQVLQMASVIGRQFQSAILQRLAQPGSDLNTWLAHLEQNGLIQLEPGAETDYAFPDALIQEVAYNSLLVNNRKALHRRVGEALEELYAEKIENHCDLLAYHFSSGDDDTRAIKYLQMAAEKAKNEHSKSTAIQHYTGLLTVMERLEDHGGQADALYQMGVLAYELGDYPQAKPWLVRAAELYQEVGDTANVGWSVMHVGLVDLKQANYDQAVKHHARALSLAESLGDTYQIGIHLTNAGVVMLRLGAYSRAIQLFKKSLKMKLENGDVTGQGFTHYYLGQVYLDQDDIEKADTAFKAARDLWLSLADNERVLSYIHHSQGLLALARQQYEQAVEHFQQALTQNNKLALKAEVIENYSYLSQACLGLGRPDEALDLSIKAITLLASQKDVEEEQRIYLNHYLVLKMRGDPEALDYLKQAYDEMTKQAERITDPKDRKTFLEKVRVNREIQTHIQEAKK